MLKSSKNIFLSIGICIILLNCSTKRQIEQEAGISSLPNTDSIPDLKSFQEITNNSFTVSDTVYKDNTYEGAVIVETDKEVHLLEPTTYHGDEVDKKWEKSQW